MSLYEVLKASKTERFPDYWTLLWGRKMSASMIKTITGTLPITFRSNGTTLINYRIYGTASGAGVQTENLFDINNVLENYYLNNNGVPTQFNAGGYVLSDYIPIASNTAIISAKITKESNFGTHFSVYDENKTFIRGGGAVARGEGIIKVFVNTSVAAFIRIDYALESFTDCMFNLGSTALPYEPYGYKLPLTVESGVQSQAVSIYIGDSKLGEGEYVDYGEQKIHKMSEGTLVPTDPPLPLPAIETFKGENTIDSTETLGEVTIKGQIKPQS